MTERRPGVWTLRVRTGRDPMTGKSRVINETFRGGERAASRRLAALVAEHGGRATSVVTLRRLLSEWRAHATHAPRTATFYDAAVAKIPAAMLDAPAASLGVADLDRLYRHLLEQGHGAPSVRAVHAMLAAAMRQGVRWGWLARSVARDASPPTVRRRPIDAPPADALARLLAVTDDTQHRLWLRLAATTAMRRGEVLALRWPDVDLDGAAIVVRAGLDDDGTLRPTKTHRTRVVPIGADLVAELRAWRRAQRERALAAGTRLAAVPFVLSDAMDCGAPWRPNTATLRFARLAKAAGLPGVRLHDLRHNVATRLLEAGHDPVTVAGLLGHSTPSITLSTYAHVVPEATRRAAADVERLLG